MSDIRTACVDAGVFIDWLKGTPDRVDLIAAIIAEAKQGKIRLITSSMAVLEAVYIEGKTPAEARQEMDMLFDQPWLTIVQLSREVAREGSVIAGRHRLRTSMMRDCAYVATAKLKGASHVYTFDQKFIDRFADSDEGVTVCWPEPVEAGLF